ncbi:MULTISPECIES: DUF7674 family protein [Niastella]|uniref:DUF7674 domain-containing protein n=1 Tax=Niastella soli TaxID=2821487 RepID=A0ABS3YNW4_9BACT|nr:hypothetical protein [Niastella soli]MBO9199578.1 hypothetical protein [Niastella soli]
MISQYEVPALLNEELPSLENSTCPIHLSVSVYKTIHDFTEYTKTAVQKHHLPLAKKCFKLAEKLYREGDKIVRMCIENIFIYSFTSLMPEDRVERIILQSYIPDSLNTVYIKQVSACNC